MTLAAPAIVRLGRVASTQAVAFALAAEGAADGTVVVADSQSAGRGRRGHTWHDEPGASLLLSLVLRPRLDPAAFAPLSLAAAVAVADALESTAGLAPRLKWPNDVLVDGRKIAGILLESRMAPRPVVVLGIGINVGQRTFPPELEGRATSVLLAAGRRVERDTLLAGLLRALEHWRGRLEREGVGPVRERWRALSDTLGRRVTVDGVTGVAVDLDADGALLVDDGRARHRVLAGAVVDGEADAARR